MPSRPNLVCTQKANGTLYPHPAHPGVVRALFQPIERMKTGEIVGFEALARLVINDALLSPATFLGDFGPDELADLFLAMLDQAAVLLRAITTSTFRPYVSINIEPSVLLSDGFIDVVKSKLERLEYSGDGSIVIELLESDQIIDFSYISSALKTVRDLGIGMALDDVGSAYASLTHLRELPIDFIKLDQSFARRLNERPNDLHFTLSLQFLANGLGKRLIVEGVETEEIHDALRVLGVDLAQGYAIARPMSLDAVSGWLAMRECRSPDSTPTSLLGAYAGHLRVVETCRVLMEQPLPITWTEKSKDPHACAIGRYFDQHGTHDTTYGLAHKAFHAVMSLYETDRPLWQAGADAFRHALSCEILGAVHASQSCC